jgi:D-amino-acid dehydrogenase
VVTTLVEAARRQGVRFAQETVQSARLTAKGVAVTTDAGEREAGQVLIACGAHSAALTAQLTGKRVPLDTERGYHLMLPREHDRLPFAVTSLERRFIMTPMETGLRLAGTVEFAGLEAPPNMGRAWQLHRLSRGLFKNDLDAEGATPWMGFRPSLPDSLPIIDRLENGRVLLAFGHHHLGLTQSAITAEMIADMAGPGERDASATPARRDDLPPLEPYRLARFG